MTAEQAAAELGYDQSYVRRLCIDGKLRCLKVGRDWLIERDAVRAWKEEPRRKPGPRPRR